MSRSFKVETFLQGTLAKGVSRYFLISGSITFETDKLSRSRDLLKKAAIQDVLLLDTKINSKAVKLWLNLGAICLSLWHLARLPSLMATLTDFLGVNQTHLKEIVP